MTKAKLYREPEALNAAAVACPQCGADVGWACGDAHCDGSHRKRIERAQDEATAAELHERVLDRMALLAEPDRFVLRPIPEAIEAFEKKKAEDP